MSIPAWFATLLILLLSGLAAGASVRTLRARRRLRATQLPDGGPPSREARDLPVRLYVERTVVGGPQSGGINRGRADLVLGRGCLLVGTHHGRVLQIDAEHPGSASCTGPRRLVLEGQHPSGITRTRLEIMVDDANVWAAAIQALGAR